MKVLFLSLDKNSASHRIRLGHLKHNAIRLGWMCSLDISSYSGTLPKIIKSIVGLIQIFTCDIFVVSKPLDLRSYKKIVFAKKIGKKIIIDLSDNHLLNNNISNVQRSCLIKSLYLADIITVPTTNIKTTLPNDIVENIFVVEDAVDVESGGLSNNKSIGKNFVILWFGHAGYTEIRPDISDSLKLFIDDLCSDFWIDFANKNNFLLEFRIISNSSNKVRDYISGRKNISHVVFCYEWSLEEIKKQIAFSKLISLHYGSELLDSTKSSNRVELALYCGKPVILNRFLDSWDGEIKKFIFLREGSTVNEFNVYLNTWSKVCDRARNYIQSRASIIDEKWINILRRLADEHDKK